jgi:hypothetical protein
VGWGAPTSVACCATGALGLAGFLLAEAAPYQVRRPVTMAAAIRDGTRFSHGHLIHLLWLAAFRGHLSLGHCDGDTEPAQDVRPGRHNPGSAHHWSHRDHDSLYLL